MKTYKCGKNFFWKITFNYPVVQLDDIGLIEPPFFTPSSPSNRPPSAPIISADSNRLLARLSPDPVVSSLTPENEIGCVGVWFYLLFIFYSFVHSFNLFFICLLIQQVIYQSIYISNPLFQNPIIKYTLINPHFNQLFPRFLSYLVFYLSIQSLF